MNAGAMLERHSTRVRSADGWSLRVDVARVPDRSNGAAALLVPATKHERDGYGPVLVAELVERGFTVMTMDLRGRGDSCDPTAFHSFPPGQRRAVRFDVAAALSELLAQPGVDAGGLVMMGEQDTADAAAVVALGDARVAGLVLISAHLSAQTRSMIETSDIAVCGLVSKEDRRGLRDTVDAYRRCSDARSRLRVVGGVGAGTTMFSSWQYLRSGEPPLERWLAAWAGSVSPVASSTPTTSSSLEGGTRHDDEV
jgi:pimeloyl-ACP methyl ester carboxylesterase